jgi:hypothetical protein
MGTSKRSASERASRAAQTAAAKYSAGKSAAKKMHDKGKKAAVKYGSEIEAAYNVGKGIYEKNVSKEDRQRLAAEYAARRKEAKATAAKYAPEAKEAWRAAKSAERKSRKSSQGRPMY